MLTFARMHARFRNYWYRNHRQEWKHKWKRRRYYRLRPIMEMGDHPWGDARSGRSGSMLPTPPTYHQRWEYKWKRIGWVLSFPLFDLTFYTEWAAWKIDRGYFAGGDRRQWEQVGPFELRWGR